MASEESIADAISREISPKRRLFRNWIMYAVVLITILAVALAPRELVWYVLIVLAGFNLLFILNYAEEATNKWKTSEI